MCIYFYVLRTKYNVLRPLTWQSSMFFFALFKQSGKTSTLCGSPVSGNAGPCPKCSPTLLLWQKNVGVSMKARHCCCRGKVSRHCCRMSGRNSIILSDKRVSICSFVAVRCRHRRCRLRAYRFVSLLLESVRRCGTPGVPNYFFPHYFFTWAY